VKLHTTATKTIRHPVVGELELTGEALTLPGDPGLVITTYTVEPRTASEQALGFLASWSGQHTGREASSEPADAGDVS
jgi:MmyB-like transcription regulator ligand binding domain